MEREKALLADAQLDREVCHLVHRLAHSLDVHVRRVGEALGFTASQVIALRELSEPITARELANRMFCEPSNATFVLDRLEERGLVQRRAHPDDRRAKQIVLTAEGERRRDEVLQRLAAESPVAPLTDDQQRSLREVLTALAGEG